MSLEPIDCGFIRLTDSAVLVAAVEMGFAAEQGIDLILHREASWSNIRDKVSLGIYPMAQMLSPMVLASNLGVGPHSTPVDVPFVLSINGIALSATPEIAASVRDAGGSFNSAAATGKALVALSRKKQLRVGVPFLHSQHKVLVNYLFSQSGGKDSDIAFVIAPPPILQDVMRAGEVDAVMVGEPWGSSAMEAGTSEILLPGAAIWCGSPEKVLGVRRDWLENHSEITRRLITALYRAALWAGAPNHSATLAEILSLPQYVDAPAEIIERALLGQIVRNGNGAVGRHDYFVRLGGNSVNFPWKSAGEWIGDQVATRWGVTKTHAQRTAADSFRSDLYRLALGSSGVPMPQISSKIEGAMNVPTLSGTDSQPLMLGPDSFFDGVLFQPDA